MRSVLWLAVAASIALAAPVAAQQGADSTYGPVRRADTLWDLALRFRGDSGVNAQQAMIAILRANPDAFVDGNINALRTGVTLRVPTAAEMAAVTRGDAAAEFARHEQAWRNRRRTGSAAPASPCGFRLRRRWRR
jgi:pilus assembly protein FimV